MTTPRGTCEMRKHTGITNNKIVPNLQIIRLNRLQRIHSRSLGLTDQLQLAGAPHPGLLRGLERSIFRGVAPHRRHREHELRLGHPHERLPISPAQRLHCVLVDLREVVGHGLHDGFLRLAQLRGGVEGGDEGRELVSAHPKHTEEPELDGMDGKNVNSAFGRVGNMPITFNPSSNFGAAAAATSGPTKANAAQDRLIVGVDFGTTYSGGYMEDHQPIFRERTLM